MLSKPASLKEPDFFTCDTATAINASTTPFASLVFSPHFSPTDWNTAVCVIAPPVVAFMALAFIAFFMAFMAFGAGAAAAFFIAFFMAFMAFGAGAAAAAFFFIAFFMAF